MKYWVSDIGTVTDNEKVPTETTGYTLYKSVTTYSTTISYLTGYHEIDGFYRYSKYRDTRFYNDDETYTFAEGETEINLYYNRQTYNLKFMYDETTELTDYTNLKVAYEDSLAQYATYTPKDPTAAGMDTSVFVGWYTTPDCIEASKVDLSTMKMPAITSGSGLNLYAKFNKTHTVITYLTEADATAGENAIQTWTDADGSTTYTKDKDVEEPTNGDYKFNGWFYRDANGNEHAFNFADPMTRSCKVYAHWTSDVSANYTVRFVAKINGKEVEIADSITGSGNAGLELTFKAKTGEDLYENYRGYTAEAESSIFMVTATEANNVFTFYYTLNTPAAYASITVKATAEGAGKDQYFLFTVTGAGIETTLAVPANGTATISGLQTGETYTVTPQTWSWRYSVPAAQQITLTAEGATAEFTETQTNTKWLSADAHN